MKLCSLAAISREVKSAKESLIFATCIFLFFLLLPCAVSADETGNRPEKSSSKSGAIEEKVPLVITSDSLEADNNRGVVTFKGNVIAKESFLLCSDELYLSYSTASGLNKVDKVVAVGHVRILHGSKVAGSDRAEYMRADSKLVLSGSAVVTECGDKVRGERIELFLDEDRVVIDGGSGRNGKRVRALIQPEKSCQDTVLDDTVKREDGKEFDGESRCRWADQVLR